MNRPLLSIIIPTYQSENVIDACVYSIINQKFKNWEIIVVDGESTDNTIDKLDFFVKNNCKIQYISEKDDGIYDAMNKGIQIAKGDWLYFLGSDDVLLPNVLDIIFKDDINQYDMIYGNVKMGAEKIYDGYFDCYKLIIKNICHQAIFYRREIFDLIGMYKVKYVCNADYALNIEIFSGNFNTIYKPVTVANFSCYGFSSDTYDKIFYDDFKETFLAPLRRKIPKKHIYDTLSKPFNFYIKEKKINKALQIAIYTYCNTGVFKRFIIQLKIIVKVFLKLS